jgi:hypothetical protein
MPHVSITNAHLINIVQNNFIKMGYMEKSLLLKLPSKILIHGCHMVKKINPFPSDIRLQLGTSFMTNVVFATMVKVTSST